MSEKKSNKKVVAIVAAVLVVILIVALAVWKLNAPATTQGGKEINVTVVHGDETTKDFTISTDAEFLRGALEQENLIEGTESEFGLFVTTVDGETADDAEQEWWSFTQDGEMLQTGVDSTPIADGDNYEITLTIGW